MVVALVQSRAVGASTAAVSMPAWSPAPKVGNLGLVVAQLYRSNAAGPTLTPPPGWTTLVNDAAVNSAVWTSLVVFARVFDGTSNDVVTGMTATSTSYRIMALEISGLATNALSGVVVGDVVKDIAQTSPRVLTLPVVASQSDMWALSAVAERAGGTSPSVAWSGGSTAFTSAIAANTVFVGGQQRATTGAVAPVATVTSTQGQVMAVGASIAFRTPTSAAPSVVASGRFKRGGVRVPAKAYRNGRWVECPVKRYVGGAWVPLP